MILMAFLMAAGTTLGKYLMKKVGRAPGGLFRELSDFAQENYSGLAVIKAFVKETKELMMFRRLEPRERGHQRRIYLKFHTAEHYGNAVRRVRHLRILGYGGLVYCGSFDAGQLVVYRLFLGRCMANHGLHADREDIPWKSVLKTVLRNCF